MIGGGADDEIMGNSSQKLAERCSFLSKNEVPVVASSFKNASKNSDKIKEEELLKYWGAQFDPRLGQFISNFLFGPAEARATTVSFERFAELFVYCTRGTVDERTNVLFWAIGQNPYEVQEVAYPPLRELIEAVCSSFLRAIKLQNGREYQSWENKGFRICSEFVQKLAESLSSDIMVQRGAQKVTRTDAEAWFQRNPTFCKMLEYVFKHLYNIRMSQKQSTDETRDENKRTTTTISSDCLLPYCEGLEYVPDYPAFIDLSQLIFINSNLPGDLRKKWRFLFSSQMHGESFSTLLGRIIEQGPTVLIVEDNNGHIFGGFAPVEWKISPNFVGTDDAFLFLLKPKMRCFHGTSINDHYQYLNLHCQTMPNGLGMGGQHDYWGIWLDNEYGKGSCSESCTTYKGYQQLSANKEFLIRNMEVWGVGEKPVKEESTERNTKKSVLDDNEDAKAILKIAGRREYSEGLREEDITEEHSQ